MRIVIIGATGNIGTGLLRRLSRETDIETVAVARRAPEPDAAPYSSAIAWHPIDITRDDAVERLVPVLREADAVVHLAWRLQPNRDELQLFRTNVTGTRNVLDAAAAAGVAHVIVASSVGTYSPGPKSKRVSEDWPVGGIHTSHYSRHKAIVERLLDAFERANPTAVVTRVRPGLVMHAAAGAQIRRLFLGRLIPVGWMRSRKLPILPFPARVRSQVVHVDDLADAFERIIRRKPGGAFNIAAEPTMGAHELADVFRARPIVLRTAAVRALLDVAWRLRLVALDPGWLDIASTVPIMSTRRARDELDWTPEVDSRQALAELIEALATGDSAESSPALNPHKSGGPSGQ